MKLYSSNMSSNSRRVRLSAAVLGVPLEVIEVDLRTRDRNGLATVNPNNKVPVLIDGDLELWESNAINIYLCDRTPGQKLLPTEPRARAEVLRWLFWNTAHLQTAVSGLNFEHLVKGLMGLGGPDANTVEHHTRLFHQFAKVVDEHLAKHEWLANDTLSLADLSVAATMNAPTAKLPVEPYRNLQGLLDRIHARPEWAATAQ
ncbi:MAG TPA: glutathione S-transferase family protein [Polyangiaceae bacterium]